MSAGIVLVIAGFWVAAQVLGGDALDRLGITSGNGGQNQETPQLPGFSQAPPGQPGSPGLPPGVRDYPKDWNGLPNGGNF